MKSYGGRLSTNPRRSYPPVLQSCTAVPSSTPLSLPSSHSAPRLLLLLRRRRHPHHRLHHHQLPPRGVLTPLLLFFCSKVWQTCPRSPPRMYTTLASPATSVYVALSACVVIRLPVAVLCCVTLMISVNSHFSARRPPPPPPCLWWRGCVAGAALRAMLS